MHECVINIGTVLPKSLKHLTIRDTSFGSQDSRCLTSALGLVTLEVAGCHGWTPLFKSLPSLGSCGHSFNGYCGHELCVVCHGRADFVFLEGLSGATNLELTAEYFMNGAPMFSRLKTLLLSDWCMANYLCGLVFFLKHSPVLEPKDKLLVSKHLEAVEINHVKAGKRIHLLLKVLAFHLVRLE
ncbi:hypothetical protein VPH35_091882 [Triticum aestivum]